MRIPQIPDGPVVSRLDRAAYQRWQVSQSEDNSSEIRRLMSALYVALKEELTEYQRECVTAYFFDGKSVSEIAKEQGVNRSTVSRTIHRGMDNLYHVLRYASPSLMSEPNNFKRALKSMRS